MAKKLLAAAMLAAALAPATAGAEDNQTRRERVPVVVPTPPDGMGQVVFFRPSGQGFIIGCTVREGETEVSGLGNGRYFIHVTTPGPHSYSARSEARDTVHLEVEPGETQYVRCNISMGIIVGRPNLSPSNEQEFARRSPRLRQQRQREEEAESTPATTS